MTEPTATGTAVPPTVKEIHADSSSEDYEKFTDEYIIVENDGDKLTDILAWTVSNETGQIYTVPDCVILNR